MVTKVHNRMIADDLLYLAGERNQIHYNDTSSIYVNGSSMVMGGFRFRGQYLNTKARSFNTASFKSVVSLQTDLGAETAKHANTWYGVFAVANEGDSVCSFKLMPVLHIGANTGSVFNLVDGGENTYNATVLTSQFTWDTDALVGVDCLAITEAGTFSGRTLTITAATSDTITVDTVGTLTSLDWLQPAPKGYDYYRYCGSLYNGASEVRSLADTGYYVGSSGGSLSQVTATGAVTKQQLRPYGNISPYASGVRLVSTSLFSTSNVGDYTESYATDTADHIVDEFRTYKTNTSNQTIATNSMEIPFSIHPEYVFTSAGAMATDRTAGTHKLLAYYES